MNESAKSKVLIVDDSPQDLQIALEFLKDSYTVVAATSGEQALAMAAAEPPPAVVLMDVTMPGMDGYEACSQLLEANAEHRVIFVSANDDTDEILKGYEVGGIDYVTKPYPHDVLLSKIELAIQSRESERQMNEQSQMASEAAMTAMRSAGELSTVIQFLRDSFGCNSTAELAQLLIQSLRNYDLSGSIQLRGSDGALSQSTSDQISSLEEELLGRMAHHSEKILEKGPRMFVNFRAVTLLVRNLPLDNSDLVGRLRDHLMIIAEGACAKLEGLDMAMSTSQQRKTGIERVVTEIETTLRQFVREQEDHKKASVEILDNTISKIEQAFFSLGLTDEQEQELLAILHGGAEESLSHFESGVGLDEQLKEIVAGLTKLES